LALVEVFPMFCQSCGTQVQPGQQFCGTCAKPLAGYGIQQRDRLQRHVQLLGVFWIAYSVFFLIGGVVLLILANTLFGRIGRHEIGAPGFLQPLLSTVAVFLLVKSIAGIAAGYGLLQRAEWARILAVILGFIALLHIPLGTLLGIYTIWALLSPGADAEYETLARAA
jgi:phage shock protein PspC (stress-responsive transcriptional regulator)